MLIYTTTPLGASAVYTSPSLITDNEPGKDLRVSAYSDQAGTLEINGSIDGVTFYPVFSGALTAATPLTATVPAITRFLQLVHTNGATAQTKFMLVAGAAGK